MRLTLFLLLVMGLPVLLSARQAFHTIWCSAGARAVTQQQPCWSPQRRCGGGGVSFSRTTSVLLHASAEDAQRTLASGSHQSEMEVKKSRFLGYASHMETWKEAQLYVQSIKEQHPKARHWCYAFRGGTDPATEERCSDDGEPTGTAGLPILGAIKGEGLTDTVCVVVRYFGGIKLGAGGLIRAYGAAARLVLRDSPIVVRVSKSQLHVRVATEHIGTLYDVAARLRATVDDEVYATDGSLSAHITCETDILQQLRVSLNDSTRGNAQIQE